MKFLLFAVVFSLFIVIRSQITVTQCNNAFSPKFGGDICSNSGSNASFPACEHGYDCLANSIVTVGSQPYCQPITGLTTPCNFTAQCLSVGMDCILNLCSPKRWAGELCINKEDCLSLNCTEGVCGGLPLGADCVASYDNKCGQGLFCRFNGTFFPNGTASGSCDNHIAIGQPCVAAIGVGSVLPRPATDIASGCEYGSLCDESTGVCTRPGTVQVGGNATLAASCNFTALSHTGSSCVDYCGTGSSDPKCLSGYFCNCGSNVNTAGSCPADNCAAQKNAVIDCMRQNGCKDTFQGPQFQSLVLRSLNNATCIYNKCQSQVWDMECCVTNFGTRGDLTPGVSCSTPPTPVPAPSISSTLSSCFLLLISVIFFIFVVYL